MCVYIYGIESRGIHSILQWSCYMQVVGANFQGIPRYSKVLLFGFIADTNDKLVL